MRQLTSWHFLRSRCGKTTQFTRVYNVRQCFTSVSAALVAIIFLLLTARTVARIAEADMLTLDKIQNIVLRRSVGQRLPPPEVRSGR